MNETQEQSTTLVDTLTQPQPKIRTIKRYANRKLYDTEDSCYVTFKIIMNLVLENADFQIIDNKDGNDITDYTILSALADYTKNLTSLEISDSLLKVEKFIKQRQTQTGANNA